MFSGVEMHARKSCVVVISLLPFYDGFQARTGLEPIPEIKPVLRTKPVLTTKPVHNITGSELSCLTQNDKGSPDLLLVTTTIRGD